MVYHIQPVHKIQQFERIKYISSVPVQTCAFAIYLFSLLIHQCSKSLNLKTCTETFYTLQIVVLVSESKQLSANQLSHRRIPPSITSERAGHMYTGSGRTGSEWCQRRQSGIP